MCFENNLEGAFQYDISDLVEKNNRYGPRKKYESNCKFIDTKVELLNETKV